MRHCVKPRYYKVLVFALKEPVQFISVQSLIHVLLFGTPWHAARQASLSITNCRSLPKPMSIELVMPSNHLMLGHPLFSFCPPSFPASGTFPMSQQFTSGDQNTGASPSASVLPMSIQGWFPLRLTSLISSSSLSLTRGSQEPSLAPQFKGCATSVYWYTCYTVSKTVN